MEKRELGQENKDPVAMLEILKYLYKLLVTVYAKIDTFNNQNGV